jgi:Tfp pilus assembly protein PilN
MPSKKSFLPEDYVREARERRSGLVALVLFIVVMGAVFSAFLVTNRQWAAVRSEQNTINEQTESAAKQIAEMKRLEGMRSQMVEKAELARGLIEPVPRSVLLACMVNTMPANLSLLEFDMKSEELRSNKQAAQVKADAKARRMTKGPAQPETPAKPEAVRRRVVVTVTGVAPDDLDVSRWMGALARIPFLSGIRLEVSEEKELKGVALRQFKISMRIEPEADVRGWEGLKDIRTPQDPLVNGALQGAKITTAPTDAPAAEIAAPVVSPALIPEGGESKQVSEPGVEQGHEQAVKPEGTSPATKENEVQE